MSPLLTDVGLLGSAGLVGVGGVLLTSKRGSSKGDWGLPWHHARLMHLLH